MAVPFCENFGFAAVSTRPNWADSVNNEARGQIVSASNFCFARATAAETPTFLQQFRSRRTMNGAVDSAAAEQRGVGGVHNRIEFEFGDVAADDVDLVFAPFHGARRSIC